MAQPKKRIKLGSKEFQEYLDKLKIENKPKPDLSVGYYGKDSDGKRVYGIKVNKRI